ncbi:hypothetical protein [Phenylobacterium sp.]|jgi:hypothetical protein|uniref:hypothetical protein n=1 Tax=Phenylobacterium sp. TaxID=1871053 RepID=UPI002E3265AF|nr:hypothetical protein [Phenylobacterium sp.]HEX3367831.1 hypothetical protein [Phenylobacterium sp.]
MRRSIVAAAGLAAIFLSCSPAVAQQCPMGSFPSVDSFGNRVCQRIANSGPATTQTPRGQQCPNGAYPTVDNFGNRIYRSEGGFNQPKTDYYDTSKGCPMGMFPSVDQFGNKVCKKS